MMRKQSWSEKMKKPEEFINGFCRIFIRYMRKLDVKVGDRCVCVCILYAEHRRQRERERESWGWRRALARQPTSKTSNAEAGN
jgi:hypothetical protein